MEPQCPCQLSKITLVPVLGPGHNSDMRVNSRKALRVFWEDHPDARPALQAWYADLKQALWKSPADVKRDYRNASFVANNCVVFNIRDGKYRVIVAVQYRFQIVFIRFVGTHQQYDKVDAAYV